jgi:hypothetical protein
MAKAIALTCTTRSLALAAMAVKLLLNGKPSSLTRDRIQALKSIGFVWDSQGATWLERLSELMDFHRVYGHCNAQCTRTRNWVRGSSASDVS